MTFFYLWIQKPLEDGYKIYWELLKVMLPIMILIRFAEQWGMIELISVVFTPFMDVVGLPPQAGFIWSTAMLVNIYAGMVAFATILPDVPMTIAEVTVLGTMILIAHSLPVEQRIVQRAGVSLIASTILRIGGALMLGMILNLIYTTTNQLQSMAVLNWTPDHLTSDSWVDWAMSSLESLFWIFWIILVLVYLLQLFDGLGLNTWISRVLSPMLRLMGISDKSIPTTMFGVILGLSYGGALIMREAREGRMSSQDLFLSLCFLCLFHSAIEDTLLIFALGADFSGIVVARFLFGFFVVVLLSQFIQRLPQRHFERYLCRIPT